VTEEITCSNTGAALFWGEQERYLVLPPFPISEKLFSSGYDVEPLRSLLQRELMLALILVRLGDYAIGVFRGEKMLSSKVGTGHIHARHKKGGSSQRRFERGREKQVEDFFDRVCSRVRERLEPYKAQLDYVVYGGEHHTLLSFRKQCRFLQQVDDRTLEPVLNVRRPRQATLWGAIGAVWSSEVIRWQES
jgi:peptide subunit release factor 1 (eRF1)